MQIHGLEKASSFQLVPNVADLAGFVCLLQYVKKFDEHVFYRQTMTCVQCIDDALKDQDAGYVQNHRALGAQMS